MAEALLEVSGLKKYFPVGRSFIRRLISGKQKVLRAVDGVSFIVRKGDALGLIGESGSGKTTTGKLILRLMEPTDGKVCFNGIDIFSLGSGQLLKLRPHMQMLFQNPYSSLNPRMKIGDAIAHPLKIHKIAQGQEAKEVVLEFLEKVGLTPPEFFYKKYPYELSGGQRQRVALSRVLITHPKLIIADEPTSMLDVSVNAQILNLMLELKKVFNLTFIVITHDIASAKYVCNRIGVMYLGKILEIGDVRRVFTHPLHPYTFALLSAVSLPEPKILSKQKTNHWMPIGEIPDPTNVPRGCRFHPRCPYKESACADEEPELRDLGAEHYVACHKASELMGSRMLSISHEHEQK